jgi:hypothetical protein
LFRIQYMYSENVAGEAGEVGPWAAGEALASDLYR